jgi:FAD:protein FMN transferase
MSTPTEIRLPHRHIEHCMGTVFSIDVRSPGVEAAVIADVLRWLHWVDETFSTYKRSSQISRLAAGEIRLQDCAPEVREVLDRCDQLSTETDGYFSAYASGDLDPSGYVKGWAIEKASTMLAAAGSANHCVNGGGDVQCAGDARPGQPWRIGIAHPHRRGDLIGVAVGNELAVATSGTAERGDHIVDPHLRGSVQVLASVTVTGRRLATVDAYATAAMAMGSSALDWIESLAGVSGLVVFADGHVWTSRL